MVTLNAKMLIGVFLGAIMVASTFVFVFAGLNLPLATGGGGGESFESKPLEGYFPKARFTLGIVEGDVLVYRSVSDSPDAGLNVSVNRVTVESVGWPDARVTIELLEAGDPVATASPERGSIATTLLALPMEILGMEKAAIPVYIPMAGSGVCMEVSLEGYEDTSFGRALVYKGGTQVGDYAITFEGKYLEDSGVVVSLFIGVVGAGSDFRYTQELVEFDRSGSKTNVEVEWVCTGDGFSSNLTYVKEGLAKIANGKVEYITPEEFREALQGDAVFVVYSKTCPHCHNDWSHLLRASEEVDVTIVIVFWGGLLGERDSQAAMLEINKVGVEGTPTFIFYKGGKVVDKVVGFTPWDFKVDKIKEIYG